MSARDSLIFLSGLNDQSTRGISFLKQLDAYRAEVLREAAEAVLALRYDDQVENDTDIGSIREAWDLGTIHGMELLRRTADAAEAGEGR
ncbi:hypothetical protein [Streptomyces sp. URMC 129]|uniref:hypothetical protein n=1 Tax=Streptomyces sp. URMC 129 TaxID=3423407 RepID=UPI003F1BD2C5